MGNVADDYAREERLNQIYLAIISRYKDYIEEKEGLSVAELPTLVVLGSQRARQKLDEIKSGFLNYNYDENFREASIKAHLFVESQIEEVVLPLQFWLTPEETLEFGMGDSIDRNILLCSLMIGLGNHSSKVFVRVSGNSRKVFVYYEFKGKVHAFNDQKTEEYADKKSMVDSLDLKEGDTAYEFNNQMYADIY